MLSIGRSALQALSSRTAATYAAAKPHLFVYLAGKSSSKPAKISAADALPEKCSTHDGFIAQAVQKTFPVGPYATYATFLERLSLFEIIGRIVALFDHIKTIIAVSVWIGSMLFSTVSFFLGLLLLPNPVAAAWLAVQLSSLALPLELQPPPGWSSFCKFACLRAEKYFQLTVKVEDPEAMIPGTAYVIGFEPHSAMPTSMPVVFHEHSERLPESLKNCKILASSAIFWCPLVRQLFYWLGIRPVSKASMSKLLQSGTSVVLNPGGIQECLEMEEGKEVAFLRQRRGFVRVAMTSGAPLIPVFAFGQSDTFKFWRPGPPFVPKSVMKGIARRIMFVPMWIWGRWGTPCPLPAPVHIVIRRPIVVPQMNDPTTEDVDVYLAKFVDAMQALFDDNKHEAGQGHKELHIM